MKKILIGTLLLLSGLQSSFAKESPIIWNASCTSGAFNLAANACLTSGGSPTGAAGGDLGGTYPNPSVAKVGTSTAANIHSAELLANAATPADTINAIVKRDASGNFFAGAIENSSTGNIFVNVDGYQLLDPFNTPFVDASAGTVGQSSGDTIIDVINRVLYGDGSTASCDWGNRALVDSSGRNSVTWDNRQLLGPSGGASESWNDSGVALQKIYNYNSDTTAGVGVAYVLATISATGQMASIASTNLFPINTTGLYRISYYLVDTTAGSTGTVTASFTWTDDIQAQAFTTPTLSLSVGGSFIQGSVIVEARAVANIKYSTALSSVTGSPQYAIYLSLERIR